MTGLHAAAAVLLVIAGLAKVLHPRPTAEMLGTLGLPGVPALAAAIGVGEFALGLLALVVGGPFFAVATGIVYVGFAVVVLRALAVDAPSCGCFGRDDTPPSWIHVVGDLVFAVASFVAAAGSTPLEVMDDQPAGGIPFVIVVGLVAGLAVAAFTALPAALDARHPRRPDRPFTVDTSAREPSASSRPRSTR